MKTGWVMKGLWRTSRWGKEGVIPPSGRLAANAERTRVAISSSVVSSREMPTLSESMRRRFIPAARALSMTRSAALPALTESVSNHPALSTPHPAERSPAAIREVSPLIR